MEGMQELTWLLEEQFKPLVQAEMSVLVDVLHRPELLFPIGSEARTRCENGGFISKCAFAFHIARLRRTPIYLSNIFISNISFSRPIYTILAFNISFSPPFGKSFSLLLDKIYANLSFLFRLINHTLRLLEEKEERLCIKVIQTLKQMIRLDTGLGEKV